MSVSLPHIEYTHTLSHLLVHWARSIRYTNFLFFHQHSSDVRANTFPGVAWNTVPLYFCPWIQRILFRISATRHVHCTPRWLEVLSEVRSRSIQRMLQVVAYFMLCLLMATRGEGKTERPDSLKGWEWRGRIKKLPVAVFTVEWQGEGKKSRSFFTQKVTICASKFLNRWGIQLSICYCWCLKIII